MLLRFRLFLARLKRVPLSIEPIHIVTPFFMTYSVLREGQSTSHLIAATVVLIALVLSIIAHELGHAGMAWRLGLTVHRIGLDRKGGFVVAGGRQLQRNERIAFAAAGPLVNIAIGALCLGLASALAPSPVNAGGWTAAAPQAKGWLNLSLHWIGIFNLLIALANLSPANPLDGGIIARAILSRFLPVRAARKTVAGMGIACSILQWPVTLALLLGGICFAWPISLRENLDAYRRAR